MNEALNGNHFDIHAGGEDLIFPHHENEIAQSTCAHGGEKYVNYWMHNGYLMVEGQKMSKSLGNVVLVHDLVGRAHGEAIRLALLSAHYRQPFDWTEELLQQSKRTLDRYYGLLRDASGVEAAAADAPQSFVAALEDDLNTPKAFAELAVIAKDLSTAKTAEEKAKAKGVFLAAGKLIGLLQQDAETWFKGAADDESAVIEQKIVELQAARSVKDYKKADEIRDRLRQEHAVSVSVTASGITWRKES
jgi:cysteinyl-tRNA synthetase